MTRRDLKRNRFRILLAAAPLALGGCAAVPTKLARELGAAGVAAAPPPAAVVTEADLAPLPAAAQRYLRFMAVVGRPRDTAFRAHLTGRFRMGPDAPWRPVEAWQYSTRPAIARFFYMRIRLGGIPFLGRDTYAAGKGRMLIRPFDLLTVQDGRGPEYDLSELVTWLNDAVLLAPSMLLDPRVTWAGVEGDADAFDLALTDGPTTVRARVFLDAAGAPRDFETTDRYGEDPFEPGKPLVRARWTTPVGGWQVVDGRPLPGEGQAIWHFPKGDLPYVQFGFAPGDLAFNVAPGP
jgi:hypothetical protein